MTRVREFFSSNLNSYVKKEILGYLVTFGGINLFTSKVITHFGSNFFLTNFCDFVNLRVGIM